MSNRGRLTVAPWLFPASYFLHVAEEYLAGFPAWAAQFGATQLSDREFLALHVATLVLVSLCAFLAHRFQWLGWLAVGLATVFLLNASAHLLGTILTHTYSPGLATALILWVPLGIVTLKRDSASMSAGSFVLGLLAGTAAHTFVLLILFGELIRQFLW